MVTWEWYKTLYAGKFRLKGNKQKPFKLCGKMLSGGFHQIITLLSSVSSWIWNTFVLLCICILTSKSQRVAGTHSIIGKQFMSKIALLKLRKAWKALFILVLFRILESWVPWRHQMPKHGTRNAFYIITVW